MTIDLVTMKTPVPRLRGNLYSLRRPGIAKQEWSGKITTSAEKLSGDFENSRFMLLIFVGLGLVTNICADIRCV